MQTADSDLTLVVPPGLDGTDVFFRPLLAQLSPAQSIRVICYPADGPHDYAGLLAYVRAQIADLTACCVLGSSFAGPLAVMLAAAEPQKVRGVILSATFVRSPRAALTRWQLAMNAPLIWSLRFARRIPVWFGRAPQDAFRIAKAETWSRVSAGSLAGRLRAIAHVDVSEELKACAQPLLCVIFEGDTVVPRACAEEILALRPGAELVSIPGHHLGMFDAPVPLAAAVARFIQRHHDGSKHLSPA